MLSSNIPPSKEKMRVHECTLFCTSVTFYIREGKDRRNYLGKKLKHKKVKIWRIWERDLEAEETRKSLEIVAT